MGRKYTISEDKINRICDAIKRGLSNRSAAASVGISHVSFYNWVNRGEHEDDTLYSKFYDGVQAASAEFEASRIRNIASHEETSWQASAWLLERKLPDEYSPYRKTRQFSDDIAAYPDDTSKMKYIQNQMWSGQMSAEEGARWSSVICSSQTVETKAKLEDEVKELKEQIKELKSLGE